MLYTPIIKREIDLATGNITGIKQTTNETKRLITILITSFSLSYMYYRQVEKTLYSLKENYFLFLYSFYLSLFST